MTTESFLAEPNRAVSQVRIGGTFRVTHDYHPSASPNLFEAAVTIENISGSPVDARYRRVMDWDVEPTPFSEFVTVVTIEGSERAANVLFSSDDGFASANPLAGESSIRFTGDAVDSGPDDHGALFDFGFGELAPGEQVTFNIYYGAAGSEDDADAALQAVRAEVYSYGQPSTPDGPTLGTPNTFVFAFNKVGGAPAVPPDVDTDGVLDELDNCPFVQNEGQADADLNGIGDACQTSGLVHTTAGFLHARLDGSTDVEAVPVAVAEEPELLERLVRIVEFRLEAGLADDASALTANLVDSLVAARLVRPDQAAALIDDVLRSVGGFRTQLTDLRDQLVALRPSLQGAQAKLRLDSAVGFLNHALEPQGWVGQDVALNDAGYNALQQLRQAVLRIEAPEEELHDKGATIQRGLIDLARRIAHARVDAASAAGADPRKLALARQHLAEAAQAPSQLNALVQYIRAWNALRNEPPRL